MGKTFAGSEIDKWNWMSIKERCDATRTAKTFVKTEKMIENQSQVSVPTDAEKNRIEEFIDD